MRALIVALATFALLGSSGCARSARTAAENASAEPTESCFLLYEIGVGEVRRSPSEGCETRVTPASTFKIAHALAALDAGVVAGPETQFAYDGSPQPFPAWQRDQTLASAMRYSVVWYFQAIATRLGLERETEYLGRLRYGNADPSSGLTTFWLGGSLLISPEEEESFLVQLFQGALPVSASAQQVVREILVQPPGVVVNATGEHPFDAPWPADTVLSAKTGNATNRDGRAVRWLVGHVQRGKRSWVFVSSVSGAPTLEPSVAMDLAAKSLREEKVL